jgi:hypothetical protein
MIYLVYPACTLLVWLALAVLTLGFVFVDVQELILLWVPGWLLYNRVVGAVADSGSILRQAARLGSILAALGFLWVMVSALLWSVFFFFWFRYLSDTAGVGGGFCRLFPGQCACFLGGSKIGQDVRGVCVEFHGDMNGRKVFFDGMLHVAGVIACRRVRR